jgi:hypothetical protein
VTGIRLRHFFLGGDRKAEESISGPAGKNVQTFLSMDLISSRSIRDINWRLWFIYSIMDRMH